MYNRRQKERYIDFKAASSTYEKDYFDLFFNKSEPYENELDKDLSNFSFEEIEDMYKRLNIVSIERLRSYHAIYSGYSAWCLSERLITDNQNHYTEIQNNELKKYANKLALDSKIISREQLLHLINHIRNPREQFMMIALFEIGKSKDFQELINAKFSDINIEQKTISLFNGRVVKVSDEFIYYARSANTTLEYNGQKGRIDQLIDDGKIIKKSKNVIHDDDFNEGRRIYYALKRVVDEMNLSKWITPNSLAESGKIHMIKEIAKEHNATPFEIIMNANLISEVEKQYNCDISSYRKSYYERNKEYFQ